MCSTGSVDSHENLRVSRVTISLLPRNRHHQTHTMMGDEESPGLMILAVDELFSILAEEETTNYLIRVSYLEIYNEEIKDLLVDADSLEGSKPVKLNIYDHPKQGTHLQVTSCCSLSLFSNLPCFTI